MNVAGPDEPDDRIPGPDGLDEKLHSEILGRMHCVSPHDQLWRIYWERNLLHPKPANPGVYRFDAPDGGYPVTYASSSRSGAFAEVYGEIGRIKSQESARQLAMISIDEPLSFVSLDDTRNQRLLGLDGRISVSKQYETTQKWSEFIHRRKDVSGIRYTSRHDGDHVNYCVFLDRCRPALTVHPEGSLISIRQKVLEIADLYDISVYLPRARRPRGGRPAGS